MIEQIANILLICLELLPIQGEPFACVRHSPHQLISGRVRPVPRSLMRVARARAPRGMGPSSTVASFSQVEIRSHIHLGFHKLLLSGICASMRARLRDKAALPIPQLLDLSFARQIFRCVRHAMDVRNRYLIAACTVITDVPEAVGPCPVALTAKVSLPLYLAFAVYS
jgi:hypothetical protein